MSLTIFHCKSQITIDPNIGWRRSAFRYPPPIFILIPPFWDKWTLGSPSPYLSSNHRPRCCGTMSHSQLWRIHTSFEPSRHNSGRPHYGIGTNRFSSLTECGPNFFLLHSHPPIHSKVVCRFNVRIFTEGAFHWKAFVPQDAVVAEVTGNGDVAKVENGEVKPEVCIFLVVEFLLWICSGNQWRCCEDWY